MTIKAYLLFKPQNLIRHLLVPNYR
jgi:hypothetical protein